MDSLLDPQDYETVESMRTVLYKNYGANYNKERTIVSIPLVKQGFRSQFQGGTI